MIAWGALVVAGLLEVVWAWAMKESHGFVRLNYTILTFGAMFVSFGLLGMAMKSLPLGTAYPVWTGIGALGAFAVGVMFMGEAFTFIRVIAFFFILSGLVLMKIGS